VAELKTVRERTELRTSDGRSLAEIDRDSVTGRALPPSAAGTGAGTVGGAGTSGTAGTAADQEVRFVEVEIELAEGSSQEVLDAVAHRLRLAGARPSDRQSKVATVLQMAAAARGPQAGADAPAGREAPAPALDGDAAPGGPGRTVRRAHALMSDALAEQAGECLGTLLDHDPALRLSDPDPEHVHQSRVGVRRLRSVMRSFAPLVATPLGEADDSTEIWFEDLAEELKWLGGALGAVRDTDVRLQGLVQECSTLPHADNLGAATLLAVAEDEQRQAHEALLEAMATDRYVGILRALEALASRPSSPSVKVPDGQGPNGQVPGGQVTKGQGPKGQVPKGEGPGTRDLDGPVPTGLSVVLDRPASVGLPALARRQWRAIRKEVRKLGDEPPDTALHRVRIQAKRLRYLSDVAALFAAPAGNRAAAKATSKAAAHLQDVLGELHDASVTEQWLRDAPNRLPSPTKTAVVFAAGLAAGELAARAQERQRALRKKWPAAWAPVQSQKLRRWMTP
jgi:CHAD domain-containing protein